MEKLESTDLEFESNGGDAGIVCKVTCPKCKDVIRVGENSWWDTECSCCLVWNLSLTAIGTK